MDAQNNGAGTAALLVLRFCRWFSHAVLQQYDTRIYALYNVETLRNVAVCDRGAVPVHAVVKKRNVFTCFELVDAQNNGMWVQLNPRCPTLLLIVRAFVLVF